MKELILVKLGGSVVTNKKKEFTVRSKNVSRFAVEMKSAIRSYKGKIILGHGAGSFAHTPAKKYQTKRGLVNSKSLYGMSVVEDAARVLNGIIIKKFLDKKVAVFPFSPASFLISDAQVYSKSYLDPLKLALDIGQIPVVYGDVIMDLKNGCTIFSTEKVLGVLAHELRKFYRIRMIFVTDVEGVYDESGKTIQLITGKNFDRIKTSLLVSSAVDVTGGMIHKVEEALLLAKKHKIPTLIINGNVVSNLKKAILGKKVPNSTLVEA
jgi:isopentenyl phosphate kinase